MDPMDRVSADDYLELRLGLMHEKFCPILGGLCSSMCIHFFMGEIKLLDSRDCIYGEERIWGVTDPKCKLWSH